MKPRLFLIAGACLLFTTFLGAKEVIKIGAILPLSGSLARSGEDLRDVLLMSADEQKQLDLKYDYKIIFEDDVL